MGQNYDPKKGIKNINEMYNEIGTNHVQINSVRIIKNQDPQPSYGIARIEELPSEENDIEEKLAHHMKLSGSKQKMDCFQ